MRDNAKPVQGLFVNEAQVWQKPGPRGRKAPRHTCLPAASMVALLLGLGACADAGGPSGGAIALRVLPQDSTIAQTDSVEFTAFGLTAAGDSVALAVTWSAEVGEITGTGSGRGLYKPQGRGPDVVTARADSVEGSATVTVLPAAPAVTAPAQGATLATATPTIAGTAEPNLSVEVQLDMVHVATVTAAGGGSWSYTLTVDQELADGLHTASAVAIASGDRSPASPTVSFTIATGGTPGDSSLVLAVSSVDPHYLEGVGFMLGYGHPLWWYHPTKYAQLKTVYETYGLNFARILLPWAGPDADLVAYTHQRTGPGTALDGGPKFDLTKIDPVFLDRLEDVVSWASERNIVVAVGLWHDWPFEGTSFSVTTDFNWRGSVVNPANSINAQTATMVTRANRANGSPDFYAITGLSPNNQTWNVPSDRTWVRDRVKELFDQVLVTLAPYANWYLELGSRAYFSTNSKRYWAAYARDVTHALDDGATSPYALQSVLLIDQPWEPVVSPPAFEGQANTVQQYTVPELRSTGPLAVNDAFVNANDWAGQQRVMYDYNKILVGTPEGNGLTLTRTAQRRSAWQALLGGGHWDDMMAHTSEPTNPGDPTWLADFGYLRTFVTASRQVGGSINAVLPLMRPDNTRIASSRADDLGPFCLEYDPGEQERYLVFATAGTNPTVTVTSAGLTITRLDAVTGVEDVDPASPTTAGANVLTSTGNDTAWWIASTASGTGGR